MKSSFELGGYEKGDELLSPQPRKTKAGMNPITGNLKIRKLKVVNEKN